MILHVSLYVNALGCESGNAWYVSPEQLEKGIYVNSLLPDYYTEYVKAIYVKIVDDGNAVEVTSDYGSAKYSVDEEHRWTSPQIGLSYATCDITLYFIPIYKQIWDILRVTHEGAIETFQREELRVGVNLATLSPRRDGSLIPWLDVEIESFGDGYLRLRQDGVILRLALFEDPALGKDASFELWSFSTVVSEWDDIEQKPVRFIIDTQDLNDSINDAAAALRVAESMQEQQPEMLDIIARYMSYAADLGSQEALAWLRDYHEVDDSKHHPYI